MLRQDKSVSDPATSPPATALPAGFDEDDRDMNRAITRGSSSAESDYSRISRIQTQLHAQRKHRKRRELQGVGHVVTTDVICEKKKPPDEQSEKAFRE
jgi:hypothetical protein